MLSPGRCKKDERCSHCLKSAPPPEEIKLWLVCSKDAGTVMAWDGRWDRARAN